MTTKTLKELAFLHDLYIATDWGERFAELVDEHVELPREGRALYVEAGTGGHALALQGRAGKKLTIVCADENEECLELARAKAVALHASTQFQREDTQAGGDGARCETGWRGGVVAANFFQLRRVLFDLLGSAVERWVGRSRRRC